jgi:predicted SprT family Zn-dependent metalloprotease
VDGSLLKSMLRWVTPREAEAKVVGDPAATQAVQGVMEREPRDYLTQRYQQIVRRAEAEPQTVRLSANEALLSPLGLSAGYLPAERQVWYNPAVIGAGSNLENPLAHELTHFVVHQGAKQGRPWPSDEEQHRVIEQMLGTNLYAPAAELQGYVPKDATLQDLETFEGWLAPALRSYQTGQAAPPVRPAGWPRR